MSQHNPMIINQQCGRSEDSQRRESELHSVQTRVVLLLGLILLHVHFLQSVIVNFSSQLMVDLKLLCFDVPDLNLLWPLFVCMGFLL